MIVNRRRLYRLSLTITTETVVRDSERPTDASQETFIDGSITLTFRASRIETAYRHGASVRDEIGFRDTRTFVISRRARDFR